MNEPFEINLDPDELTIEDMEAVEDVTRASFDKLRAGKLTHALIFIAVRKEHPEFTWEDAGKVKVKQLNKTLAPLGERQAEESSESEDSPA